jgi:long-chain acyl-CoA synthetase
VKFEDGRTGSVSATLKMMDAKTFPPAKAPPDAPESTP